MVMRWIGAQARFLFNRAGSCSPLKVFSQELSTVGVSDWRCCSPRSVRIRSFSRSLSLTQHVFISSYASQDSSPARKSCITAFFRVSVRSSSKFSRRSSAALAVIYSSVPSKRCFAICTVSTACSISLLINWDRASSRIPF